MRLWRIDSFSQTECKFSTTNCRCEERETITPLRFSNSSSSRLVFVFSFSFSFYFSSLLASRFSILFLFSLLLLSFLYLMSISFVNFFFVCCSFSFSVGVHCVDGCERVCGGSVAAHSHDHSRIVAEKKI